jgi:hypothetical protein
MWIDSGLCFFPRSPSVISSSRDTYVNSQHTHSGAVSRRTWIGFGCASSLYSLIRFHLSYTLPASPNNLRELTTHTHTHTHGRVVSRRTWIGYSCASLSSSLHLQTTHVNSVHTHTRNKRESCSNPDVDWLRLCILLLSLDPLPSLSLSLFSKQRM